MFAHVTPVLRKADVAFGRLETDPRFAKVSRYLKDVSVGAGFPLRCETSGERLLLAPA